jgi:colicin import membrane protein
MTAAAASMFDERADPGKALSALLAAAMHVLLFLVLVFGVQWQNKPPDAVQVELWNPPAEAPPVEEPKPVPKVEPPPVEVKPEPVVVKPEPVAPKPDIVEKKAPPPTVKPVPKPLPKPVAKVEPKPVPRPEPAKAVARPRDEEAQRMIREQLQREQASLAVDRERQHMSEQLAREASAARNKAMADWVSKVRAKIRGNVVLPLDIKGNPEAIFDVVQLPTGEVLKDQLKLRKSSGHTALDDAIERAILKSSPFPKPDKGESAPRAFELKYRPLD